MLLNVDFNMTTNVGIHTTTNVGINMPTNVGIDMTTNVGIGMMFATCCLLLAICYLLFACAMCFCHLEYYLDIRFFPRFSIRTIFLDLPFFQID